MLSVVPPARCCFRYRYSTSSLTQNIRYCAGRMLTRAHVHTCTCSHAPKVHRLSKTLSVDTFDCVVICFNGSMVLYCREPISIQTLKSGCCHDPVFSLLSERVPSSGRSMYFHSSCLQVFYFTDTRIEKVILGWLCTCCTFI